MGLRLSDTHFARLNHQDKAAADTGASEWGFISTNFVKRHKLYTVDLARPCNLKLADRRLVEQVTKAAQVTVQIGEHLDLGWAIVTNLKEYNLIHGIPWFQQHKPRPNWEDRAMTLDLEHCMANCISSKQAVYMRSQLRDLNLKAPSPDICTISANTFIKIATQPGAEVFVL
jgi:hypothetical protein